MANAEHLGQVVVNLMVNAARALSPDTMERNEIRVVTRRSADRMLIEVHDNGCGIPEPLQHRSDRPAVPR